MGPLVLRKPNGTQVPLLNLTPLRGIVDRAEQKISLLTEDTLTISLDTTEPIDIGVGDTLPVFGQLYTLNNVPNWIKQGEHRYRIDLSFEGPQYHLLRVVFFDTDVNGNALSSTFSLTGNLQFFAEVLFANMVRVFSGAWGLGSVSVPGESTQAGGAGTVIPGNQTAVKTLTFENENCLSVLQRLCAEWGTEFSIEYRPSDAPNRILSIGPAGQTLPDSFSYGQGNGLTELSRRTVTGTSFFTRAYIFGGSKNLPSDYRGGFATRLQLPAPSLPAGSVNNPWDSKIDDPTGIALYGLIEGTQVFEEIYPGRIGTVAEVVDPLAFTDPDLDFNPFSYQTTKVVNGQVRPVYDYIIEGLAPKVSFLTGELAGYSFELVKFFENNFILQLRAFTDERGMVFPSEGTTTAFKIAVGDTYTLIDMNMPPEYVTAAENKLLAAGQAWLAENGAPSVEYSLSLDELFLQAKANDTGVVPLDNPPNFFAVGDAIRVIDTELSIDKMARITGFTRDVLRPYKYTLTLGDTRKISRLQRVLAQQTSIRTLISSAGLNDPSQAPATVPRQPVSQAQLERTLLERLRPFAHAARFTLTASVLPAGFMPTVSGNPVRHELLAEIFQGNVNNPNRTNLGTVLGIGRRRPFHQGG